MVDNLANVSWKQGNPTHGLDMFGTYSGTASDLSHLLDHIGSYLPYKISSHICGGVSLGGHATWQVILGEPRVKAGIVVIGCPDYVRLMTDRAIRSGLPSAVSEPPGLHFLGSNDFPPSLIQAVESHDPAGILLGELDTVTGDDHLHPPSPSEQKRLRSILSQRLAGKKIVCVSGGIDRLVPYACGEPFLSWLKRAIDPKEGWAKALGIGLVDFVDPDARHEFTVPMREVVEEWLCKVLAGESGEETVIGGGSGSGSGSGRESKM
jgi:pimeloyl-ACP methyl ester carboxylesterase